MTDQSGGTPEPEDVRSGREGDEPIVSSWRHSTEPLPTEPEPEPRSKAPIVIGSVALVVVLALAGLIAALVSRQGPSGVPTEVASATRAPLELPIKVNDLQRDPNAQPSMAPTAGAAMSTVTAVYNVQGTPTLVVVAGRPVHDPNEMLTMVDARAIRQVGAGWCGRESNQDIDVCVVMKGDTAVLGGGLDQQPVEEIIAQAQSIADALPE